MLSADQHIDDFLIKPRSDVIFKLHISRNTFIAIVVSLLLHAMVLLLINPLQFKQSADTLPARELEVSLAPPTQSQKKADNPVDNPATKRQKPIKKLLKPSVKPKKTLLTQKPNVDAKPVFKVPDVLTIEKPVPEKATPNKVTPNLSIPKELTNKEPLNKDAPADAAPTDMMAYVNQQRARRNAQESDAARQNAEATARELGPTAEQKRDENIKRNFQTGVNGIFEITSLSANSARFSFNGWTNDFSSAKRQYFEVESQTGQDVRLTMIKKMISLIRQHYQGDFNWESRRLNRIIVMSARVEDSEGLEEFMMMEFFGKHYKTSF